MVKSFKALFVTQFLGAFNDNVYKNALIVLITFTSLESSALAPEELIALCGGVFILPFFLFSSLAGEICDRYDKSFIARLTKYLELAVMTLGAVGFYLNNINFLIAVLFLMGTQSTFFGPVKYSLLPEVVENKDLLRANGWVDLGTFMAILLGTICGGVLQAGQYPKVYVSFAIILLAVLGIISSHFIQSTKIQNNQQLIHKNILYSTFHITRTAFKNREIKKSIGAISWFWCLGGMILSIIPVYAKEIIQGSESMVTYFLALFSVGVGIGSVLCPVFLKKAKFPLILCMSLMSAFLFDISSLSYPHYFSQVDLRDFIFSGIGLRISFDFLSFSIFSGLFIVPLYTLLQEKSSQKDCSKVIATNNIFNALWMVIGAVILMIVYHLGFGVIAAIRLSALLNLSALLYYTLSFKKFQLSRF